jgi:hypothetical protein
MYCRSKNRASGWSSASEADSLIALQREIVAQRLKQEGKVPPSTKKPLKPFGTCRRDVQKQLHQTPSLSSPIRAEKAMGGGNEDKLATRPPMLVVKAKTYPPSIQRPTQNYLKLHDDDTRSLSTATMTACTVSREHQVLPLQLPTFKPAVGCISANPFLVRCFVARMRKGVTVTKHSRSRFQKASRAYILQLEPDDETLTWRPCSSDSAAAHGSSNSNKRWHLADCLEVRISSSMDPENPAFLGTSILRDKCDTADAHKSFALIFKYRSLDFTSATADQCKMLTEGFSALCYQLHQRKAEPRNEVKDQSWDQEMVAGRKGCFLI